MRLDARQRSEGTIMRLMCAAVTALFLLTSGVYAQYYVEADLNGVLGDSQPDIVVASAGQDIMADIWILASPGLTCSAFGVFLCNHDFALEYQGTDYYPYAPGWACFPPEPPDSSGCILLYGVDLVILAPMEFPYRVASVTYRTAVDHAIADLTLGPTSAVMTLPSFSTFSFVNNGSVLARVQIGDVTATEASSWGSIKALFR